MEHLLSNDRFVLIVEKIKHIMKHIMMHFDKFKVIPHDFENRIRHGDTEFEFLDLKLMYKKPTTENAVYSGRKDY